MKTTLLVSILILLVSVSCADNRPEKAEADFRKDARSIFVVRIDSNSSIKVGFKGYYFVGILADNTYVKLSSPVRLEKKSVRESGDMVYVGATNDDDVSSGQFPAVNLTERTLTVPTVPESVYSW